jgi:hypothetical protein
MDDGAKVDLFVQGFDGESPYWDKLTRLREKQVTFQELVEGLTQYYASIVSIKVATKDDKLDSEDGTPKSSKVKKRKTHKKDKPVHENPKTQVMVPKLIAEDYKNLTAKER